MYEKPQDDIQMERHGEKATTFSGKDSQPTYMELVDNRGELVSGYLLVSNSYISYILFLGKCSPAKMLTPREQ